MPDVVRYTPAQMATEVNQLVQNYNDALNVFDRIEDSIEYSKEGTQYESDLVAARAEIAQDNEYFDDISEAIVDKDGGTPPAKADMAGRISALQVDPNANFDAFMNNTLEHYSTTATAIPEYCFLNKTNMTSINMPNVVSLGEYAFDGCSSLVLSSLPTTIVTIPPSCFRGCSSLGLETLPTSLTTISQHSFYQATLAITKLPSGITSIGNQAFRLIKGISYLDMSEVLQIPTLGISAFLNTTFPFYFADQAQLDAYAAATNWSTYANRFQIKPTT